jgi:hypothetical protein
METANENLGAVIAVGEDGELIEAKDAQIEEQA